jgi:Fur family peroxide stress response transcriptional regulator
MVQRTNNELINQFFEKSRKAGLNVTPQRLAVYKALISDDSHPSPDTIHKTVKPDFPTISFATVYKILETFEKKGIISKVTTLHNTLRYDSVTKRHHHIICVNCKKIIDLKSKDLDSLPIPAEVKQGNKLIDFNVHFNVICCDCQEKH